jgi:hypothetical protein
MAVAIDQAPCHMAADVAMAVAQFGMHPIPKSREPTKLAAQGHGPPNLNAILASLAPPSAPPYRTAVLGLTMPLSLPYHAVTSALPCRYLCLTMPLPFALPCRYPLPYHAVIAAQTYRPAPPCPEEHGDGSPS